MKFEQGGNGQYFSYEETVDCGHNHLRKVLVNETVNNRVYELRLSLKNSKLSKVRHRQKNGIK